MTQVINNLDRLISGTNCSFTEIFIPLFVIRAKTLKLKINTIYFKILGVSFLRLGSIDVVFNVREYLSLIWCFQFSWKYNLKKMQLACKFFLELFDIAQYVYCHIFRFVFSLNIILLLLPSLNCYRHKNQSYTFEKILLNTYSISLASLSWHTQWESSA